ncbi:discoidin domain-containing protein [Nocardia sp. NBC_01730]|uniref:hypothetical protein n=1 Tax=Nocardia sp. NBC_01730 TaxID=2975998 RepID=UPI002E107161|nr:discoidin domain-containing protein [Nocardia sp. NBC_01730]
MTTSESASSYPDIRWGRITAAMPAADGYPAENMIDDNSSTFYLSAEAPQAGAEIRIGLGYQYRLRHLVIELGDGAGNYLWPNFSVWYSVYGEQGWRSFGPVGAGVQRIEVPLSHGSSRVTVLKLVVDEPCSDPVAVRTLDIVADQEIPTILTSTPNPLPVSTFDELQYGRLRIILGPMSGADQVTHCTGIAIRVPLGRHAQALADNAAAACSVNAGNTGVRWTPLAPDLSDPDVAVFRFVPEGRDSFDNTRRVEFTVSGLEVNGAPWRVPISVDQVAAYGWRPDDYFVNRSRYVVEKVANEFYVHSFRPASTVVDYNRTATLLWDGVQNANYTISYRDSTGAEQTAQASGGSWTSPPLFDATNFTLTATRGGHVRHLTTHLEVGRKALSFTDFTATENITVTERVALAGGAGITIGSPGVTTRGLTVERPIRVTGGAVLTDSLTVTGAAGLSGTQIHTAGDVEVVGSLDARLGISHLHGAPQIFAMRSGIEQTFTPPTDGYVMVSVTRQPGATGEARIGSEGATVWASPPTASGEPEVRSAILPVRKGNATTVKYTGSGSSSATLLWMPLGTGTISGVG